MTRYEPGIIGLATYLPSPRMTAGEIAEKSGLPEWIVRDKLGIEEKVVPGPEDHPHQMAVNASVVALRRAQLAPEAIDAVISITEEWKEYPVWTTATALAGDLGLSRAWAFDIAQRCGTGVLALKVAKDLMIADSRIRHVLIAGGYQNVDLVDYANPRVRFLYNLGAGAGAVVVGRRSRGSRILGSAFRVDGELSRAVLAPRGGTRQPLKDWERPYLDVPDPLGMRDRLNEESLHNFLAVVDEALVQSGRKRRDIRFLSLLHMKRSAHDAILSALNLEPHQSIYLSRYGHIGQVDQMLSTELALQNGLIRPGDLVVWVSAGIGYAWNAVALQWGELP